MAIAAHDVTCVVAELCVFFLDQLLGISPHALLSAELGLEVPHLSTEVANSHLLCLRTRPHSCFRSACSTFKDSTEFGTGSKHLQRKQQAPGWCAYTDARPRPGCMTPHPAQSFRLMRR